MSFPIKGLSKNIYQNCI